MPNSVGSGQFDWAEMAANEGFTPHPELGYCFFIDAVKPALVVISNGRGNPYGHPLPYVLERYRAAGARIFRIETTISTASDNAEISTKVTPSSHTSELIPGV